MVDVTLNTARLEGLLSGLTQAVGQLVTPGVTVSPVNSSAFATNQITCGTSATLIIAANASRKYLSIKNVGANPIYVGPSGVTTANGYPVAVNAEVIMKESVSTAAVYGVVAGGTEKAAYLEW